MRVGVLTGGGDCPGLNAVIRAVVRKGVHQHDFEFVGYRDGWKGPLEGLTMELGVQQCRGILPRGGTILGSSRTNPFKIDGGVERIKDNLAADGVDALVAIGGEDTLGVATRLADLGVNVVGVPKTIDNDLSGTDFTFGFDTAVNIAMEAIDRLHTTAESHHRVLVVEVMGRHAGWIALHAGIAGGANVVLIPEQPFDIEAVCALVKQRFETKYAPIVVVSEGAVPAEGGDMTLVSGDQDAFGHVRLGAHRRRGPRRRARPHPARRHPDGLRPLAGHPLRAPGDRCGRRRRLRHDDGAARDADHPGAADRGHRQAQAREPRGVRRGTGLLRLRRCPGLGVESRPGAPPAYA
jgi:6-phosphofructokinase